MLIIIFSAIAGVFIGVLIGDIPYFSVESKIRPFEAATFLFITIFGYWYQTNQKNNETRFNTHHKTIENIISESCETISKITKRIEEKIDKELTDIDKKIIHQDLRNISKNIHFIEKKTKTKELTTKYISFKDCIANEDFSTSKFTVDTTYYRDTSNSANELKVSIRDSIYSILTTPNKNQA